MRDDGAPWVPQPAQLAALARRRRGSRAAREAEARRRSSEALVYTLRALPADQQIAGVAELAKSDPWRVTLALVEAARTATWDLADRLHFAQLAVAAAAEIPEDAESCEALHALNLDIQLEMVRIARLLGDHGRADEAMAAAARLLGLALDRRPLPPSASS